MTEEIDKLIEELCEKEVERTGLPLIYDEEYLEYLKAKVIIEQDADFYPDWSDLDEEKYYGFLELECR